MSLIVHCGAQAIDYADLQALETPEGTPTHCPIGHMDVVEMVRYSLGFYQHEVIEEHHAVTEDGARYFGVLSLKSAYGDYVDTVGLRNSHDKKFPIGIAIGARVFVCDNLSFCGDHIIKRRHTPRAKRDLPGLVAEVIDALEGYRRAQREKIKRYQGTPLTNEQADAVIMKLYRERIINVQRIAPVARAWDDPPHDWGGNTAWKLFNCVTFAMRSAVTEDPSTTGRLHSVIDRICGAA